MLLKSHTTLPKHIVTIQYHMDTENFTIHCSVCGSLGYQATMQKALNRKFTHDRGQDAGAD